MRIAHVVSNRGPVGGAERVLAALVREGHQRGWEQLVLNPFAEHATGTPLHRAVEPVPYLGLPCPSWRQLAGMRRRTAAALRSFAPDVVHAHMFHALVTVSTIRRRGEARVLSHQHGRLLLSRGRGLEARVDRIMGRRYDRIVGCSDDVSRFLVSSYGYPAERVSTIHNGWEGEPRPRIAAERPTAVCVANLRPEKGHETLLEAWEQVVTEVPGALLRLVGGGPLEVVVRASVQARGLGASVELTGAVDDVWPELARADVFVLPTLHEPFGIVAVEAMAAGLPVVVSKVGGLLEFVEHDRTGRLVPPGDAAALAQQVVDLLRSPETRDRLRQAGLRQASRLTMAETVNRYVAVYEDVADAT